MICTWVPSMVPITPGNLATLKNPFIRVIMECLQYQLLERDTVLARSIFDSPAGYHCYTRATLKAERPLGRINQSKSGIRHQI